MASNPIQKKVRNAGLIGAAVTLVIMSIVVAFLLMKLYSLKEEQKQIEESYIDVYTLNQDVKSGQIITEDMLQLSTAQIQHTPNNAVFTEDTFINYSLTDSEGNQVYTDKVGTYLNKTSEHMEIFKEENKYYTYLSNGQKEEVTGISQRDIYEDEHGLYLTKEAEGKTRLYQETETEEYYILKVKYNTNSQGTPVREKEYVDILGVPLLAKIDMNVNTVLTVDMVSRGSLIGDDVRKQEYNAIVLPVDLTTGDYIDIRALLPNGQDFIVVSKKEVEIPVINEMDSESTIWVNLSEEEILTMSCAIVEAYKINGTKLYATKYTDPGMQEAAIPTYPISAETLAVVRADPNIADRIEKELINRYTAEFQSIRVDNIHKEIEKQNQEEMQNNVTEKVNESIVKTQEERKKYLQSLAPTPVDDEY